MILIKKKSLVVTLVSSLVIFCVLILTLIGYVIYLELKEREFQNSYEYSLHKINAKIYSKHIDISKLNARIENIGPLRDNPIIEGTIKNNGTRDISDLLIKVTFLDYDGAVIYEVLFHPQEPALGASLAQVSIPYLSGHQRTMIKPGGLQSFKKILNNCPKEIREALKSTSGFAKKSGRWSGKLASEIISLDF